jgi:hypothetical protein
VNYGPRCNSFYIAIPVLLLLALFTFLHTITFYHSIRLILCLQQTGEINNLIVSWGKVLGCVVCMFHVAASEEAPTSTMHQHFSGAIVRSVTKLASINLLKFDFLVLVRLNLGFTTEGNLLLCSSYLPLGVPNLVYYAPSTSTAGKMKIMPIFILRIAWRFQGGDGFCSMRMRCSLRSTSLDERSHFA